MGSCTSNLDYINDIWYPMALKNAKLGKFSCEVNSTGCCHGADYDLAKDFEKLGITEFKWSRTLGDPCLDMDLASWKTSSFGIGLRLHNISINAQK